MNYRKNLKMNKMKNMACKKTKSERMFEYSNSGFSSRGYVKSQSPYKDNGINLSEVNIPINIDSSTAVASVGFFNTAP